MGVRYSVLPNLCGQEQRSRADELILERHYHRRRETWDLKDIHMRHLLLCSKPRSLLAPLQANGRFYQGDGGFGECDMLS